MAGKLYLCATPIGNLDDITYRVLETLKSVDLIAAEDTRNSIKLLNHFDIHVPMTSYHEFNKIDKAKYLVNQMLDGTNIALITDAGTPGRGIGAFLLRSGNRSDFPSGSGSLHYGIDIVRFIHPQILF